MSRSPGFIAAAVALTLVAPPVHGQGRSLVPTAFQAPECYYYIQAVPKDRAKALEDAFPQVTSCLDQLSKRASSVLNAVRAGLGPKDTVKVTVDGRTVRLLPGEINGFLIKEHTAYKRLRRWVPDLRDGDAAPTTAALGADVSLRQASDSIHAALELRGLNEVFSAALVSGAVITSGQQLEVAGSNNTSDSNDKTKVSAHLVWETKHFTLREESTSPIDFSLRGKLGFIPALTLVQEKHEATPPAPDASDAESAYQEALLWDMAGRINLQIKTRASSELTLLGRVGQTILGKQSILVDRGGNSTLALPVANGSGSAEVFWELGAEFSLYNNPIEVVHAEGSAVSPLLTISLVYRNDNRFKKEGALVGFDSPDRRGVFRFMIDALKVVDKRELAEKPKVFTVGFGVEHEFGLSGGKKVPSGTKLVLRGDVDLLRALQGK